MGQSALGRAEQKQPCQQSESEIGGASIANGLGAEQIAQSGVASQCNEALATANNVVNSIRYCFEMRARARQKHKQNQRHVPDTNKQYR